MRKVFGVGINDLGTSSELVDGKRTQTKVYTRWKDMLRRCYDPKYQSTKPSYVGCVVCDEWLILSVFKEWFDDNHKEDHELDKDILSEGCKIYSPDTCSFVPKDVNVFLLDRGVSRKGGLSGTKRHGNKFQATCHDPLSSKRLYIGTFSTPEEAHEAWKKKKHEFALTLCEEYPTMDERIKERLSTMYL